MPASGPGVDINEAAEASRPPLRPLMPAGLSVPHINRDRCGENLILSHLGSAGWGGVYRSHVHVPDLHFFSSSLTEQFPDSFSGFSDLGGPPLVD